jgi:hypothetical protein
MLGQVVHEREAVKGKYGDSWRIGFGGLGKVASPETPGRYINNLYQNAPNRTHNCVVETRLFGDGVCEREPHTPFSSEKPVIDLAPGFIARAWCLEYKCDQIMTRHISVFCFARNYSANSSFRGECENADARVTQPVYGFYTVLGRIQNSNGTER